MQCCNIPTETRTISSHILSYRFRLRSALASLAHKDTHTPAKYCIKKCKQRQRQRIAIRAWCETRSLPFGWAEHTVITLYICIYIKYELCLYPVGRLLPLLHRQQLIVRQTRHARPKKQLLHGVLCVQNYAQMRTKAGKATRAQPEQSHKRKYNHPYIHTSISFPKQHCIVSLGIWWHYGGTVSSVPFWLRSIDGREAWFSLVPFAGAPGTRSW